MRFIQLQYILFSTLFAAVGVKLLGFVLLLIVGLALLLSSFILVANSAHAVSRIKDIVTVEGIRDNMLVGYGLVVGLNGTGDKFKNSIFTEKSLQTFLDRLGVNVNGTQLKVKNVAAVTVTATLPPFARAGSKIDVTVSALGDASSLQGGTLISASLEAADGNVYAVAQGTITLGGFSASGDSTTVTKGVPTNGFVSNGAIIEREIPFELDSMKIIKFALRNPDITTAFSIADKINKNTQSDTAHIMDPGTVSVTIPPAYHGKVAHFLAKLEQLQVKTDQNAKIIIDEASGTIVMNDDVRIDTVAISQGNLIITIKEEEEVSQPNSLSGGETTITKRTEIDVSQPGTKMKVMKRGADLKELVDGLNSLGVGPRDLISILQTIKLAGALQAEIETR